jgi:ABC-2 type transport system permease protein
MRDIQHLIEIALLILFWASPIVYSFSFVHSALDNALLENIYLANPVTLGVIAMQKGLWEAGTISPTQIWPDHLEIRMLVAIVFSLLLLVFSQRVFSRLEGNFAQEL